MTDDPRRQPLTPPRVIRGNVPAHFLVDYGYAPSAPAIDLAIDPFLFP